MSTCVVLSDAVVHDILMSLSKDETKTFLDRVATSLKDFSVGDERSYQPEPAVVRRADGRKNLFRSFTSSTGVGVKIIVDPSAALTADQTTSEAERNKLMGLHGVLALCDQNGFPVGFVNAEELTGYRTSLSAMILFAWRRNTANIVVFGAGKQALWHMRLALTLRGDDIKKITVVNRSAGRTQSLLDQISEENKSRWKSNVEFDSVPSDDEERLEQVLGQADVVFCTTPSKQVLFPARYLTSQEKGCYVSAIGSWQTDMIELDPELLRNAAQRNRTGGLVVVDNREDCMKSTGEVIQSRLEVDKIIEVGEILDLVTKPTSELQEETKACLETGFVVYKSIGVSVTDLSAGQAVLDMARTRQRGLPVPDF